MKSLLVLAVACVAVAGFCVGAAVTSDQTEYVVVVEPVRVDVPPALYLGDAVMLDMPAGPLPVGRVAS